MLITAAMKMMEHEMDKLKEMQLSDALEKESLRHALETMKGRMERLEKDKKTAEEVHHMARPPEEQLVGLLEVTHLFSWLQSMPGGLVKNAFIIDYNGY